LPCRIEIRDKKIDRKRAAAMGAGGKKAGAAAFGKLDKRAYLYHVFVCWNGMVLDDYETEPLIVGAGCGHLIDAFNARTAAAGRSAAADGEHGLGSVSQSQSQSQSMSLSHSQSDRGSAALNSVSTNSVAGPERGALLRSGKGDSLRTPLLDAADRAV
jgi:hypothetical protein